MAIPYKEVETCCIDDDQPWLPFTPRAELVLMQLLAADAVSTKLALKLRASPGIELPRHRLTCPATIYTLQGRWRYRERDWIAGPGSLVIEPAHEAHTPQVMPDGTDDAVVLVVARGQVELLDAENQVVATEDWRSAVERYRSWCIAHGVAPNAGLRTSASIN